ncbi:hypothetical protein ACSNLR_22895 [Klebsiella pneumoniae]|uniref:hypothetical protein n=1 Tax=Klebsiella pneumoniae TaxID=573 RepID=UPI001CDAA82D|nr:hypothetical protein [Klebsiella pneumoniae]HBS6492475.1 hypothetical protein [Klebsiella pneumoniae]HDZ9080089.1 hypothetical protein [Klebsiella pneumoniae]
MKLGFLLFSVTTLFLSGCTTPANKSTTQSYQHITYVGCKAKFGNAEPIENAVTIVDFGDSFIIKGSGGDFYSDKLVLKTERFIGSEPNGQIEFSKGVVGGYSKIYLVHLVKDNLTSIFDCTSAMIKN